MLGREADWSWNKVLVPCRLPVAASFVRLCVSAGSVCLRRRVCVSCCFFTPPRPPAPVQRQLLGAVLPQTPSCTQGAYSHARGLFLRLLFVSASSSDAVGSAFSRCGLHH